MRGDSGPKPKKLSGVFYTHIKPPFPSDGGFAAASAGRSGPVGRSPARVPTSDPGALGDQFHATTPRC